MAAYFNHAQYADLPDARTPSHQLPAHVRQLVQQRVQQFHADRQSGLTHPFFEKTPQHYQAAQGQQGQMQPAQMNLVRPAAAPLVQQSPQQGQLARVPQGPVTPYGAPAQPATAMFQRAQTEVAQQAAQQRPLAAPLAPAPAAMAPVAQPLRTTTPVAPQAPARPAAMAPAIAQPLRTTTPLVQQAAAQQAAPKPVAAAAPNQVQAQAAAQQAAAQQIAAGRVAAQQSLVGAKPLAAAAVQTPAQQGAAQAQARQAALAQQAAQQKLIVSDRTKKEAITKLRSVANDLRNTPGYEWSYKDPAKHGKGRFTGGMAQDLEKTKTFKSAVKNVGGVKMVDGQRLVMSQQAALHDLQRQVDRLSKVVKRKGGRREERA